MHSLTYWKTALKANTGRMEISRIGEGARDLASRIMRQDVSLSMSLSLDSKQSQASECAELMRASRD